MNKGLLKQTSSTHFSLYNDVFIFMKFCIIALHPENDNGEILDQQVENESENENLCRYHKSWNTVPYTCKTKRNEYFARVDDPYLHCM